MMMENPFARAATTMAMARSDHDDTHSFGATPNANPTLASPPPPPLHTAADVVVAPRSAAPSVDRGGSRGNAAQPSASLGAGAPVPAWFGHFDDNDAALMACTDVPPVADDAAGNAKLAQLAFRQLAPTAEYDELLLKGFGC